MLRTELLESFAFINVCIRRNVVSVSEISAINLLWGGVCLLAQ